MELFVLIISIVSALCGLIEMIYSLYVFEKIKKIYGKKAIVNFSKKKRSKRKVGEEHAAF